MLRSLLPAILKALAATSDPDQAFIRFDGFLRSLGSGVQTFSLFQSNPILLELLAEIVGSAPALAAFIGHSPALFDAVLDTGFNAEMPDQASQTASLDQALEQALDFQDVLDITRRWVNERKFQIGVKTVQSAISVEDMFVAHTALAEVSLNALYPPVYDAFNERHGKVRDAHIVTIGMGSFGGRETSFTSDLDLIFIYDGPDLEDSSSGPKALPITQYYARFAQRYINAVTAQTSEGRDLAKLNFCKEQLC